MHNLSSNLLKPATVCMYVCIYVSRRHAGELKSYGFFFLSSNFFFIILDKKSTYLFDDSGNYKNICIGSNVKNMPLSLQDFNQNVGICTFYFNIFRSSQ